MLRVHPGLENVAAKRLLRDTVDDSRYAANLLIDADSLLAMDNYVREVRPLKKKKKESTIRRKKGGGGEKKGLTSSPLVRRARRKNAIVNGKQVN